MTDSINAANAGTIKLGDLTVNRMGFGAMRITGDGVWGEPKDRDNAIAVLCRAVELGTNFIDTADAYGPDVSENLIKEALHPYNGTVIATKGGMLRDGPGLWSPDGHPEHLREALEGSLQRLGVDTIDLYQFHRPDPAVPFMESLQAIIDFKQAGKTKHIGLSNVSLEQLQQATAATEIVSVQNLYNISNLSSQDVLDYCTDNGIAFIPYFPIGGGNEGFDKLQAVADKHQADVRQIALAWLLAKSPMMLPIPGTASIEHLESNIAAASIRLSEEDLAQLG